jgi:hypothetical protein
MPEVPADQPAQNVAENPPNQNSDQPVVAPDIIQMGNVVAPEPAIKKQHKEENFHRTAGLFNMAKVVQPTKGNISFETAKAFKLQAEDPNCTLKWDQLIMKDGREEIALMLCNPLYANLCPQNELEPWPADSNLDLMQIANIIYKIYSPPQSAGKNQLQRSREAAFRYGMDCEQLEIKDILAYQEDINTHYMGEKITVEQDHILAENFYKKIPTNCPLADDFKQRTLEHLANKNTKFDAVFSACYRLRVLLAEFSELRRKASTYAPTTYAYRIKHEDRDPNSFGKIDHHSKFQFTQQPPPQKVACNGSGMTNHSTSDCFWEGHPLHNSTHPGTTQRKVLPSASRDKPTSGWV